MSFSTIENHDVKKVSSKKQGSILYQEPLNDHTAILIS